MSWSKVGNIRGPQGIPGPTGPPGAAGSGAIFATGDAAITLSGHRVVTPDFDGTLRYATNDNEADLAAPLWVTTGAAAPGDAVSALAFGSLTEPTWNWVPGPVYLGTNGQLTQTPPVAPDAAFIAQVGIATSPTSLFVDRTPSIKIT